MAVSKSNNFNSEFMHAVGYPLILWVVFLLISFFFGFTSYPDLAQQQLLSNGAPFIITFAFGFWIGAESYKNFGFAMTIFNALIVSTIAGIATILFTDLLINNSGIFLTYTTSIYSRTTIINAPFVNLAISTCIGSIFVAMASAGAIYSLLSITTPKKSKK